MTKETENEHGQNVEKRQKKIAIIKRIFPKFYSFFETLLANCCTPPYSVMLPNLH